MDRGSYLGGSTIIGPGTNWSDNELTPIKTKKNKKTSRTSKDLKLAFLNLVIDSELNGSAITSIPNKSKAALTKLVNEKGGIQKWAVSQSQYEELKIKKLKNKKSKEKKLKSSISANNDLSASISALETRIKNNKDLIKKAEEQIEEDEQLIQHIISESKKLY